MRIIWKIHRHIDVQHEFPCGCAWLETEHIVRNAVCLTQIRKLRLEYGKSA